MIAVGAYFTHDKTNEVRIISVAVGVKILAADDALLNLDCPSQFKIC